MARSKYRRAMFTHPGARIFTLKNPKLELHYYTSAGFHCVQIWKPGASRNFHILAARSTLKLKASLRGWINTDKAKTQSTKQTATTKPKAKPKNTPSPKRATIPKSAPVTSWNPAQIATAQPKQHTQHGTVHCTNRYTPLRAEKRSMIERAKRALFG